jgi:hypothetical protein
MTEQRRVTAEEILAAMTIRGGWTRRTLESWGVPWPPPKGWRRALENGEPIPVARHETEDQPQIFLPLGRLQK